VLARDTQRSDDAYLSGSPQEIEVTTALLIIDMQADFFIHATLASKREQLTESINQLDSTMRNHQKPVIWVRQEYQTDLSDAPLEVRKHAIHVTIKGTAGAAILPELAANENDHTIVKKRYSAFFETGLDTLLEALGCRRLIIAGVNTHACIRTTVVDAYQRDLEVILASDCVASRDPVHHDVSWRYMEGKLATGMTNTEIAALVDT
jgi:nicotinamidase-related amidase